MTNNELPKWTWNGVQTPINELDYSQLYSIKNTLKQSNKPWFGQSKQYWLENISKLIRRQERENIDKISKNSAFKRTIAANGVADKIIQIYRANEKRTATAKV